MKTRLYPFTLIIPFLFLLNACEETTEDIIPPNFYNIELNPDLIYIINSEINEVGTRLDPLLNDSIKVNVNITYSTPQHGTIDFIENEGFYYKPEKNYFGQDSIVYTVCYLNVCLSEKINLIMEPPYDPVSCEPDLYSETVFTSPNTPIEVRIFENDTFCGPTSLDIFSPEKGTFDTYSYSGSYKNTIYLYFPPKDYVGNDTFRYRIYLSDTDFIEAVSTVVIE